MATMLHCLHLHGKTLRNSGTSMMNRRRDETSAGRVGAERRIETKRVVQTRSLDFDTLASIRCATQPKSLLNRRSPPKFCIRPLLSLRAVTDTGIYDRIKHIH